MDNLPTEIRPVRVLVVGSNVYLRLGVVACLKEHADVEVVGAAADHQGALELHRELRPRVVIAGLWRSPVELTELTRSLLGQAPDTRILVLAAQEHDDDVVRVQGTGVHGFLSAESPADTMIAAVRAIHADRKFFPAVAERPPEDGTRLTRREREVLEHLARGASNKDSAAILRISQRTVQVHVMHILEKLGCNSRSEAVATAVQRGILRWPGR
jgi:DNA-binding NarL/FixJ family response regulator